MNKLTTYIYIHEDCTYVCMNIYVYITILKYWGKVCQHGGERAQMEIGGRCE